MTAVWGTFLKPEDLGEKFTVSVNGNFYKVAKIKVNKKKKKIQITKLENADKNINKAIKKETKGDNGLSFKTTPFNVTSTTKVEPKIKDKKGEKVLKFAKIEIFGKMYKAKAGKECKLSSDGKYVEFMGENLAGKYPLSN